MKKISDVSWKKIGNFLNEVANERWQNSDGPGQEPTHNSHKARELMKDLGIQRRKPSWLQ